MIYDALDRFLNTFARWFGAGLAVLVLLFLFVIGMRLAT